MTAIVAMGRRHCRDVARLHLGNLRSRLLGRPGLELLTLYYSTVIGGKGGCGYVAEVGGQVIGYVCGIWNPSVLRAIMLKQHWQPLLFWAIAQMLLKPAMIFDVIGRVRSPARTEENATIDYELRPIVVAPSAQGSGAASQLVEALVADAERRGSQQVRLVVDMDNARARAFYAKVGFLPTAVINRSGIRYVLCKRQISKTI